MLTTAIQAPSLRGMNFPPAAMSRLRLVRERFPRRSEPRHSASTNLYAYVRNDPLNSVDSTGLCTGSRIVTTDGACSFTGGHTTESFMDAGGEDKNPKPQGMLAKAESTITAVRDALSETAEKIGAIPGTIEAALGDVRAGVVNILPAGAQLLAASPEGSALKTDAYMSWLPAK